LSKTTKTHSTLLLSSFTTTLQLYLTLQMIIKLRISLSTQMHYFPINPHRSCYYSTHKYLSLLNPLMVSNHNLKRSKTTTVNNISKFPNNLPFPIHFLNRHSSQASHFLSSTCNSNSHILSILQIIILLSPSLFLNFIRTHSFPRHIHKFSSKNSNSHYNRSSNADSTLIQ